MNTAMARIMNTFYRCAPPHYNKNDFNSYYLRAHPERIEVWGNYDNANRRLLRKRAARYNEWGSMTRLDQYYEEARKRNGNLPGQGGVFNLVNLHVYHYAENNPVKYTDPDGRKSGYALDNEGAWGEGHAGLYMEIGGGKYAFFEVTGISNTAKGNNGIPENIEAGETVEDRHGKETAVLSNLPPSFPTGGSAKKANMPTHSGALLRVFKNKTEMEQYLKKAGFDTATEFDTSSTQDRLIYDTALLTGMNFSGYNLITNNCGQYARAALASGGVKTHHWTQAFEPVGGSLARNAIPKWIGATLILANPNHRKINY